MEVHAAVKSPALLVLLLLLSSIMVKAIAYTGNICTLFDLSCYTDLHKNNSVVLMLCGNTLLHYFLVSSSSMFCIHSSHIIFPFITLLSSPMTITTNILRPFSHLWELAFAPHDRALHFTQSFASFLTKPLTFMSLSTIFSHVIFGLPLPLLPSTVISILFFTQSFPSFLNTCPIHLSLLHLITSLIFSIPILSLSSAFVFFSLLHLSSVDMPYIHLTILISALKFCFLLSIHCPCFTSIYH